MGLLAENRHQKILQILHENGRIEVADIATQLGVTEVTVRRDLTVLQKNGLLRKTYGGAVLAGPAQINPSVSFRGTKNLAAKKIIGKLASQQVQDGDVIYLEGGSTCYEIIPHLKQYNGLTIITNSLYHLVKLHEYIGHKIIVIGGQYRPQRMDMIGPSAEAAVAGLAGFKAFTGADDISIETGISGADVTTVSFTRLVLRQASKVIFVGDHTKFDNPALYKITDIDQLDAIVTNAQPSQDWLDAAAGKNIQLVYPDNNQ